MESIEIELKEVQNDAQKIRKNPYVFCERIPRNDVPHNQSWNVSPYFKTNASIIGLRVGSNCDENLFRLAFNAIGKIDRFLKAMALLRTVYKPYFLVSIRTTSNYLKHLKSAYKLF